ncbi:MAG TPA: hypothetical protein VEH48_01550 [Candidatus Nitrosopolaris sp.]|nr:hypothetical protein [Candidatus Nitrosopolaris sp.]
MVVAVHVIIALLSIAYSSYLLFSPSRKGFFMTYALVAATIASGTYLAISTHTPILKACLAGLLYISVILVLVVNAQRRFAAGKVRKPQ